MAPAESEVRFLDNVQIHGVVDAGLLDAPDWLRARIATSPWLARRCEKALDDARKAQTFSVARPPTGPSMGF